MFTACMAGGESHPPAVPLYVCRNFTSGPVQFLHILYAGGRSKTCSEGSAKKKVAHLPKNVKKNRHISA